MAELDVKKDPRGFIAGDMAKLNKTFPRRAYTTKDSIGDIMYQEGIQKVLRYIETNMIAGHSLQGR